MKRLNLGFLNRVAMRWRSARMPSRLFGFFHLDEDEWKPVDKEGDVRTELLVILDASELGDDVEGVAVEVLEINELQA